MQNDDKLIKSEPIDEASLTTKFREIDKWWRACKKYLRIAALVAAVILALGFALLVLSWIDVKPEFWNALMISVAYLGGGVLAIYLTYIFANAILAHFYNVKLIRDKLYEVDKEYPIPPDDVL